jgi:hypothetical protein
MKYRTLEQASDFKDKRCRRRVLLCITRLLVEAFNLNNSISTFSELQSKLQK